MADRPGVAARRLAIAALARVEAGAHAHVLVPELLARSDLPRRDRGFVTEHVHGTLRRQRLLDALLAGSVSRPIADLDPEVRAALRLGAHQLLMGVAPHAAVGETVAAAPARARGFVNAVLRALSRRDLGAEAEGLELGARTSHPDWIVEQLVAELGAARARAVLDADNEPPPVTLRLAPGTAADEVVSELVQRGASVEAGRVVPSALIVHGGGDPAEWPAVRSGQATVQDQASQAVVAVLDPRPGERVVDVAAAPGGKATAIAEQVGPGGLVVALDRHPARLRRVVAAARRLRLSALQCAAADGRALPLTGSFDAVLVDAPCTGLGVLRRRADARWRVAPQAAAELAALQRALLAEAWKRVRPGGRLLYSVCTWTPEETVEVARFAAEHLPGAVATAPGPPFEPRGAGGQLWPSAGCDGMFVARFERRT